MSIAATPLFLKHTLHQHDTITSYTKYANYFLTETVHHCTVTKYFHDVVLVCRSVTSVLQVGCVAIKKKQQRQQKHTNNIFCLSIMAVHVD